MLSVGVSHGIEGALSARASKEWEGGVGEATDHPKVSTHASNAQEGVLT